MSDFINKYSYKRGFRMIKTISRTREIEWDRWVANAEKYPDKEAIVHWVAGEIGRAHV